MFGVWAHYMFHTNSIDRCSKTPNRRISKDLGVNDFYFKRRWAYPLGIFKSGKTNGNLEADAPAFALFAWISLQHSSIFG